MRLDVSGPNPVADGEIDRTRCSGCRDTCSHSFVYFIAEAYGGPIKIGHSKDPTERLTSLQAGNPRDLVTLLVVRGGRALEKRLHARWAEHRMLGEWFSPDPEILSFVEGSGGSIHGYRRCGT